MKRILLRSVPDPDHKDPLDPMYEQSRLDYREALKQVVRKPLNPQAGADMDEMRKGIRVLDALDKAHGEVLLEDADWEHLVEKLANMRWALVDSRIVDMVETITMAPSVESVDHTWNQAAVAP